jgi:hypothetical protein
VQWRDARQTYALTVRPSRLSALHTSESSGTDIIALRHGAACLGRPSNRVRFQEKQIFRFCKAPRQVLGPTQPPIQWATVTFLRGQSSRDVKVTTHLHLVPRLRMHGAIPALLHMSSWRIS